METVSPVTTIATMSLQNTEPFPASTNNELNITGQMEGTGNANSSVSQTSNDIAPEVAIHISNITKNDEESNTANQSSLILPRSIAADDAQSNSDDISDYSDAGSSYSHTAFDYRDAVYSSSDTTSSDSDAASSESDGEISYTSAGNDRSRAWPSGPRASFNMPPKSSSTIKASTDSSNILFKPDQHPQRDPFKEMREPKSPNGSVDSSDSEEPDLIERLQDGRIGVKPRELVQKVIKKDKYYYDDAWEYDLSNWTAPSMYPTSSNHSRLRYAMSGLSYPKAPISSKDFHDNHSLDKPRLRSMNYTAAGYVLNGVIWEIIGWRVCRGKFEYLVKYRSPTPDPGSADTFACALVGEDNMPADLVLNYTHFKEFEISNLSRPERRKEKAASVDAILMVAWDSLGKAPLTPQKAWNSWMYNPELLTGWQKEIWEFLGEVFALVKWKNGSETWESGHTMKSLFGGVNFLRMWPTAVVKARSKWQRIRGAAGERNIEEDYLLNALAQFHVSGHIANRRDPDPDQLMGEFARLNIG
ncbi:hypothetical protein CC78DRAFT_548161 [Lojkania enalia]|uniref:Uncharacterized protein n=1 Tax=Lojkania enalia TaxID=147567 RepID=A0A9P4MZM1_9PLEO|nr:hypothetical protein CC78DRAFT_548161 [Didymosphaeria enalia]